MINKQHSHGLHPVKLNLSHSQIRKAHAGHPIQISHSDIGVGHLIHVHPETHKKLLHAHKNRKGSRIHLTHHELAGAGFMDFVKSVASPVLSGLQGVAKEIFPSHADTIDSIRNGIRAATGYGLKAGPKKRGRKQIKGPQHFPAQHSDHYGFDMEKKTKFMHHGDGINPSGFY